MIELKHISKSYLTKDETVQALKDVSLELPDRGLISIIGPSGCGKTTLLNILGGLDHPDDGHMFVHDINTHTFKALDWDRYRNNSVGFVFQHYHLMAHLNVLQNLELPLLIGDRYDADARRRLVQKVLELVGLSDKLFKHPHQLSGGQQQKIAIARALIKNPDILIADEPTGSLDEASSKDVLALLKEISKTKLVVVVTHQVDLAKTYSDQIIHLAYGAIERVDTIKDLPSETSANELDMHGHIGMPYLSIVKLSILNLWMQRFKVLLLGLIASIGMMGIGLVVATSYGFDDYIETQKEATLNSFPIRVDAFSLVVPMVNERFQPNMPILPDVDLVYPRNLQYEFVSTNQLTESYYTHVQGIDPGLVDHIFYDFRLNPGFVYRYDNIYGRLDLGIGELDMSEAYVQANYDIVSGRMFDAPFELIVVLDRYQRIGKDLMMTLGFDGNQAISFDELLALDIKYIPNDILYIDNGTQYQQAALDVSHQSNSAISMPVVGIVRLNNPELFDLIKPGLYYRTDTTEAILESASNSAIVIDQIASSQHVMTLESLNSSQKDNFLRRLGYATFPIAYTIIPKDFDDKDAIMDYLIAYNETVDTFDAIEPLDLAGIGLATVRQGLDAITFILYIFAGISLIISNVMIGMMTYQSVLKRQREIGVLKSMGMRRLDIGRLFYSESIIIGLLSSMIAIGLVFAILPLLNHVIFNLTGLEQIAHLNVTLVLMILLVHLMFSSITGWIPAQLASKKDPVVCLRVE